MRSNEENRTRVAEAQKGKGRYIYQNNTNGDLLLPKQTHHGVRRVLKGAKFEGDDYFMQLVKTGDLRFVEAIEHDAQPNRLLNESTISSEKLITEQPPTVTTEGTVEYYKKGEKKTSKLNETPSRRTNQDVLLNEDPMANIEII